MRRPCALFTVTLCLAAVLRAGAGREDLVLTMDDGVQIDASLFLPSGTVPDAGFPCAILVHGLGGDKEDMFQVAQVLSAAGYAAFAYSVRGQGQSGGERTFLGHRETEDLRQIIAWLANRPDIDGRRIAVIGGSQGGQHAWWAALQGLNVRTVIAVAGFTGDLSSNGCIEVATLDVLSLPSSRIRYGPLWNRIYRWVLHDEIDSLRAVMPPPDAQVRTIQIPVMLSLAYRDLLFAVNEGIRQFALLPGPKLLHLGTGFHGAEEVGKVTATLNQLALQWLSVHLKGEGSTTGMDSVQVVYHVDETWDTRTASNWPPEDAECVPFYLNSGGSLALQAPTGELSLAFHNFLIDPTFGPEDAARDEFGPATAAKFHRDVAAFVSAPFPQDVEWAGSPVCRFRIRWGGQKAQLHVQFYDVSHEGVWRFLQRGNLALRGGARDTMVSFRCQAYAHVFRAGHRLGVRLTNVDFVEQAGEDMCYVIPFFEEFADTLIGTLDLPLEIRMPLRGWGAAAVATRAESRPTPHAFALSEAFPNPFNEATRLTLTIRQATRVDVRIVDLRGRQVRRLLQGFLPVGKTELTWDGRDAAGLPVASGVYFVTVRAGNRVASQKLRLVR